MIEHFLPNQNPEKVMRQAEQRQQNFQREQNAFMVGTQEENKELVDLEQKSDLIKWQQNLDDELIDLVYRLKGWVKMKGEWFKPDKCQPLCNDLFINDVVIPQCKPFLSRNLINSNLTEDRILLDLRETSNDIADNMADGYDLYDIDFQNSDLVLRLIKNVIKAGAFRSLNGWTKKTDSTIFKRIESSMENEQQEKKKGLFNFGN